VGRWCYCANSPSATAEQEYVSSGTKYKRADDNETRLYLGGSEWVDDAPENFSFGDGRIVWEAQEDGTVDMWPQYRLTDHLGNTVVLFDDKDEDGIIQTELTTNNPEELEVKQRLWYYPFGMQMDGIVDEDTDPRHAYRYNGKELEAVSKTYEYGFRYYDPGIGRFTGVDPISDQFAWVSVYNYAENSPIGNIDLWGLQKFDAAIRVSLVEGTNDNDLFQVIINNDSFLKLRRSSHAFKEINSLKDDLIFSKGKGFFENKPSLIPGSRFVSDPLSNELADPVWIFDLFPGDIVVNSISKVSTKSMIVSRAPDPITMNLINTTSVIQNFAFSQNPDINYFSNSGVLDNASQANLNQLIANINNADLSIQNLNLTLTVNGATLNPRRLNSANTALNSVQNAIQNGTGRQINANVVIGNRRNSGFSIQGNGNRIQQTITRTPRQINPSNN
jgi:RHS repeat-associated protein